jgi:NAD-dependent deacetylase
MSDIQTKLTKIVVFSGAGISAESGISTFRDSNGLWENHNVDQVANIITWKNNYKLVHDFYNQRRIDVRKAQPNEAHKTVVAWQKKYDVINLTQNIDDLFEKAGTEAIHLHGFIHQMKCMACGNIFEIQKEFWDIEKDRCECGCRKGIKPNVVFFHEDAPNYLKMHRAIAEIQPQDIWITIGTSHNVIPIQSYLSDMDCRKILVNKEVEDHYSVHYDEVYVGNASEILPTLEI